MAHKYQVRTVAERFIHNDLSNCAYDFQSRMRKKIESGDTEGVYHDMMASLLFSAFSTEAKVNFIGWKTLKAGWPERASFREKIDLLTEVLKIDLTWGEPPLQSLNQLFKLRNTLAHGKPEIVDETKVSDVEPEIWDALKGQWERSIKPEFVDQCRTAEDDLWKELLNAADISIYDTLTHGQHSLETVVTG